MSKKQKLIPEIRFPEFKNEGEWETNSIGEVFKSFSGGTPSTSEKEYYGGDIPFIRSAEINKEATELFLTEDGLKNSSAKLVNKGDLLVALYGANSGDSAISKINGAINQAILCLQSKYSNAFTYNFLTLKKDWIVSKFIQGGQGNLSGDIVKSIPIPFPKKLEQQKIASCLLSLDDLIEEHSQKLVILKEHKKGLMQNLFQQEGEKVPKVRFKEFEGDWEERELNTFLDYLQPTDYLVKSTDYNDDYKIPVLTAGKSFILGYTNETEGTFKENLPVIIFDDFTTASQFVDFPFKGKSSAMKILTAKKNVDIKFIFEAMQLIKYEVGVHQRHWISIYSNLKISAPKLKEQQKIANCLFSLDELIFAQTEKIEQLKLHKKGLMQGLFPKIND